MSRRRFRTALLRIYSPKFRERYGMELLDTLEADDTGRSRLQRAANDIDLMRNGIAQRFGSDVVADIEGGVQWVGLLALSMCIAWSTVSLTSSIKWNDLAPTNPMIAFLWSAVLLASLGRLLLPRRWASIAWFLGLAAVIWSTITGYLERNAPVTEEILAPAPYLLRWQTAGVAVLLLLGAAAPMASKRRNLIGCGSGLAAGALLTLRFSSFASFTTATTATVSAGGPISYAHYASPASSFSPVVVRGTFVDLTRVDLLPDFGWWYLVALLLLASLSIAGPRAAVVATVAAVTSIVGVVAFDALHSVPAGIRLLVPLAVVVESTIVLAVSWRRPSRLGQVAN